MADVKSKNLYELLGNDSDQDSDREPPPPVKAVDKTAARSGKRDAPKEAPVESAATASAGRGGRGGRGRGFGGSEEAFRDRNAGRTSNRSQPTEGDENGRGRRGGRGPRGPRRGGDRHSRSGQTEHVKQADQSWGAPTGDAEWTDEKAGEAIAKKEEQEGGWDAGVQNEAWASTKEAAIPEEAGAGENGAEDGNAAGAAGDAEEEEDNHKSYAEYLAEQNAKRLEHLGIQEARQPNEGAKDNKKWKGAKALTKEDEPEEYFPGKEDKVRKDRDRAKPAKERVDIDFTFKEQTREPRGGARGRGRGRGERGERGEFRGRGRGDFGDREGGHRGGRGEGHRGRGDRGDRGEFRGRGRGRGGRDSDGPAVPVHDESAFPSLGAK